MGRILILVAACIVVLGGCDSHQQQREAAQRKADEEILKNAKDYRADAYGSGKSIYTPNKEKSK